MVAKKSAKKSVKKSAKKAVKKAPAKKVAKKAKKPAKKAAAKKTVALNKLEQALYDRMVELAAPQPKKRCCKRCG